MFLLVIPLQLVRTKVNIKGYCVFYVVSIYVCLYMYIFVRYFSYGFWWTRIYTIIYYSFLCDLNLCFIQSCSLSSLVQAAVLLVAITFTYPKISILGQLVPITLIFCRSTKQGFFPLSHFLNLSEILISFQFCLPQWNTLMKLVYLVLLLNSEHLSSSIRFNIS